MKHPVHKGHHGYGAEWMQALFTLAVLVSLYQYSLTFDSDTTGNLGIVPKKQTSSYWNENIGYGFRGNDGDSYTGTVGTSTDNVSIIPEGKPTTENSNVKVSFYTNATIQDIEKLHTEQIPRTYSRLSNGIAVIEGDLSSPRAKNILATLHAR